jgi:hypothetical protein
MLDESTVSYLESIGERWAKNRDFGAGIVEVKLVEEFKDFGFSFCPTLNDSVVEVEVLFNVGTNEVEVLFINEKFEIVNVALVVEEWLEV